MALTTDQLRQFSARLALRRAELLSAVDSHKTHRSDGATHLRTHRGETDDDAVVDAMDAMEITGLARSNAELAIVEAALDRLARGGFGECSACGKALPLARLEAAPDAALCIACQEAVERAR
jgi:DnaK suppressor protein